MKERLRSVALARSRWRDARWLVIAPHPDDETLGCAGLICETAQAARLAGVAFLTDGGGSHPCATLQDRLRLVARRKAEACAAMRVLAPNVGAPLFLSWPDAAPHAPGSTAHRATLDRLVAFCTAQRVDAIAVTGRDEPHCDHVAAFALAVSVAQAAARAVRVFEYIVWAKRNPDAAFAVVRTKPMVQGRRNLALAQHRSQLMPASGGGFRVPDTMRRMPASDLLFTRMGR